MGGDLNGSIIPRKTTPGGGAERAPTRWAERGVSRRSFVKFCAAMTGVLALPDRYMPRIAAALETVKRPALVWLEFQN
jgi:hydrogenase small subunit